MDVRESETVFRAVTQGGIRSEGTITGVDSGGKRFLPEEDISALEIPDRTAWWGTVSLMLVSIPAAIIVLGTVFSNRYHGSVL